MDADYSRLEANKKEEDGGEGGGWCSVKNILLIVVFVILAILAAIFYRDVVAMWKQFEQWCKHLGWAVSIVSLVLCWLFECLMLPSAAVFALTGVVFPTVFGKVLGIIVGIVSCMIGTYLGCLSAYPLGRTLLKPYAEKKIKEIQFLAIANRIIAEEGWKFAFLMRLSPFCPIEPLNYACVVTEMSFADYALSCLGTQPVIAFLVYLASTAADFASGGGSNTKLYVSIGINVPVIILLIFMMVKMKHKYDKYVAEATMDSTTKASLKRVHTISGLTLARKRTVS